ncbi:MAG: hypothetical protein BCS36_06770 [Desulfovibrio sp. MES5]|nr:MAG: hypothetical protein BCS36_06770 [Desulfovibrio sp. MES5]
MAALGLFASRLFRLLGPPLWPPSPLAAPLACLLWGIFRSRRSFAAHTGQRQRWSAEAQA